MWHVFSFFDSPCLCYRVLHNGSFCQLPEGKPSAPRSTSGYSAKRACILSSMSFPGDMILRKYLMMHISKYTLNGSVWSKIHGRVILTGIVARMEKTLFQIRAWCPHELRVTATMVSHDSNGATCKSNDCDIRFFSFLFFIFAKILVTTPKGRISINIHAGGYGLE